MSKSASDGNMSSATIVFGKDEKQHCFEVNGRNVTVIGNPGKHDHGSSKVKIKNIVDYKWAQKNYPGRLIACHKSGKIIAYAITVNHRALEGMVRIVHLTLGQRALIKGMSDEVLDLEFAHISSKILLGIIEQTALHVYRVDVINDKISCSLLIKIADQLDTHTPVCDKIAWCPYLPDSDFEDEYASQLLVWTRGNSFHCYSISTILKHYGAGDLYGKDLSQGVFRFRETLPLVTGAIFSADGTTLAVSCDDGIIRFYQVYQHTNECTPRCLHQWKPHGGKTITSFFFLDNYTEQGGDQTLWKHAITCSDNNTEIKVWCCETWECTQTIKFASPLDDTLCFKAELDPTSSYLVLSDMLTRQLYVLQVRKESQHTTSGINTSITNGKANSESDEIQPNEQDGSANTTASVTASTKAMIASIAEFPLSSPILSFVILDAAVRMCKTSDAYLIEELDEYEEENSALYCIVIRMFLVGPKSVQECNLFYQPNLTFATDVRSTMSSLSSEYRNISHSSSSGSASKEGTGTKDATPNRSGHTIAANVTSMLDRSLNSSDKGGNETIELSKILSPKALSGIAGVAVDPPVAKSTGGVSLANTSSGSIGSAKQPLTLMTPDSFSSTSDKTDKHKSDEAVNPNVLNTLFMLANATKQQQQQQLKTTGVSPNDTIADKPSPLHMLNMVNSTMIEEQEQAKVRKSVELQQKQAILETPPAAPVTTSEMLASGGSSPSREVQEILSLKDNDCLNEYYDSDNILLDETDGIGADDEELNDLERLNFDNSDDEEGDKPSTPKQNIASIPEPCFVKSETTQEQPIKSEASSNIKWPKIPEVPPQSSFISSSQVQTQPQPPMIVTVPEHSKQLDELTVKLDRLADLVAKQSQQIGNLHSSLKELRLCRAEDIHRLETVIRMQEATILQHTKQYTVAHDNQVCDWLTKYFPRLFDELVTRHIPSSLQKDNMEFVHAISTRIDAQLSTFLRTLKADLLKQKTSDMLSAQTTIEKVWKSPPIINAFATSVEAAVRKGLEQAYYDSVRNVIIPGYERSSQELFRQLNATFSCGTKEYLQKMDQYVAQNKQTADRTNELIELVKAVPEQINTNVEHERRLHSGSLREDLTRDFKLLQGSMLKVVRENIRHEIQKGLEAQASSLEDSVLSAVRSQAQTPAPSNADIQEQIKQFLASGQTNKAFHKALLSNDLTLVDYTLEKAEYKQVFNPCQLEQTVLLSLVQQISADMSNHSELKNKYLSDAIVSLNFSDPITKEHAPKVLRELTQNCQSYLSANPSSPLGTSIKMLMIAIPALGFKQY